MIQKKIKINLNSTETTEEYLIEATINEYLIEYKEPDNTHVALNRNKNILKRDNEKITMSFQFDLEKITNNIITLKELNYTLEVQIKTNRIINEQKIYLVEYEIINNDKIIYKIEIGE